MSIKIWIPENNINFFHGLLTMEKINIILGNSNLDCNGTGFTEYILYRKFDTTSDVATGGVL